MPESPPPPVRWTEALVVPEPLESCVYLDDAIGLIGGESVAIERGKIAGIGL